MTSRLKYLATVFFVSVLPSTASAESLDDYWARVTKAISEGDFPGYVATFHPDAVYVDGTQDISYPISDALARWKQGFDDTAAGRMTANVEFRFSTVRMGETTAHQTGMFHYSFENQNGEKGEYFIHINTLMIKKKNWMMMMENQKKAGTREEWDALSN